jgi:NADPH-dependent 7-cyano-7-deazaguanine reductase QueF
MQQVWEVEPRSALKVALIAGALAAWDELTAVCPITGQPDLYVATIEYWPEGSASSRSR